MDGLPPEMQARIASIIEQAKAQTPAPVPQQAIGAEHYQKTSPPPAPVQRQPSLMDHVIMLRQEMAALNQKIDAMAQVTEAVGNATGQLYAMFHQQTETTTYSQEFAQAQPSQLDDY
jgi:hypothetical protein